MTHAPQAQPPFRYLVAVQGKGTADETRITTGVKVYWSEGLRTWVSIPDAD